MVTFLVEKQYGDGSLWKNMATVPLALCGINGYFLEGVEARKMVKVFLEPRTRRASRT